MFAGKKDRDVVVSPLRIIVNADGMHYYPSQASQYASLKIFVQRRTRNRGKICFCLRRENRRMLQNSMTDVSS